MMLPAVVFVAAPASDKSLIPITPVLVELNAP
jgi:hypothetical protein